MSDTLILEAQQREHDWQPELDDKETKYNHIIFVQENTDEFDDHKAQDAYDAKEDSGLSVQNLLQGMALQQQARIQELEAELAQLKQALYSQNEQAVHSQNEQAMLSQNEQAMLSQNEQALHSQNEQAMLSQNEQAMHSQNEQAMHSQNEQAVHSQNELMSTQIPRPRGTADPPATSAVWISKDRVLVPPRSVNLIGSPDPAGAILVIPGHYVHVSTQVPWKRPVSDEEAINYVEHVNRIYEENLNTLPPSKTLSNRQQKKLSKEDKQRYDETKACERARRNTKQDLIRQMIVDLLNLSQSLYGCRFRFVSQVEQRGWQYEWQKEPGRRGYHVLELIFKTTGTISVICKIIVYIDSILGLNLEEIVFFETMKSGDSGKQIRGCDAYFCFAANQYGANDATYALECVKKNFEPLFGKTAKIALSNEQKAAANALQEKEEAAKTLSEWSTRTKNRLVITDPNQVADLDQDADLDQHPHASE